MSGGKVFASTEVALHRINEHFPCAGSSGNALVLYACPCETATMYACAHCGECLAVSLEQGRACEHFETVAEVTDGMSRPARLVDGQVWVSADIGAAE